MNRFLLKIIISLFFFFPVSVFAKKADFIGVEGGKTEEAKQLSSSIRAELNKTSQVQLVPSSKLNLGIVKLTMGCINTDASCLLRIAQARSVSFVYFASIQNGLATLFEFSVLDKKIVQQSEVAFSSASQEMAKVLVQKLLKPTTLAKVIPKEKVVAKVIPKEKVVAKVIPKVIPKEKVVLNTPKQGEYSIGKDPRFWGWITLGVAVAAGGAAVGFGVNAQNHVNLIKSLITESQNNFVVDYKKHVQPLEENGKTSALMSNVFMGVASAAAVTAIILFVVPRKKASKKMAVLPTFSTTNARKMVVDFQIP